MKALHEVRQYGSNFMVWYSAYANMSFFPHWHKEIELIFVRAGSANIGIANQSFAAEEGDLLICDSDCIHYSDNDQISNLLEFIVFDPGLVHSVGQYAPFSVPLITKAELRRLDMDFITGRVFSEVPDELRERQPYYQEIIKALLREFWYKARRVLPVVSPSDKSSKRNDVDRQVRALLSYLEANFQENITLADAAQKMNFSECYFSRCFKKYTGTNFSAYMNMLRIEKAINRLQTTTDSVSRISLDCGFNDLRNFNRVFRKLTGFSPSDFRRIETGGTYSLPYCNRKTAEQVLVENDSLVVIHNLILKEPGAGAPPPRECLRAPLQ